MITLRIDVDYQYPSRIQSFIYTTLGIKSKKNYLKNPKIVARMINESPKRVKAYWFFTPSTIPDSELLMLLNREIHEIGLHIANNPYDEWKKLEESTGQKVRYYTVHGTARLLARVMWKRFLAKTPEIPRDFPLESFYEFPVKGLDIICYSHQTSQALRIVEKAIREGFVIHFHPIWLFQRGKLNHRGPFYETLKSVLDVDKELQTLETRKRIFFTIARNSDEYEKDITISRDFTEKLIERGVDLFNFIERRWSRTIAPPSESWIREIDDVAALRVTNYEDWFKSIGKKTRNMIRKADKYGIRTDEVKPNHELAKGIWEIINETPIRQGRAFPHYGASLERVKRDLLYMQNCTYIGAYLHDELVGFIQLYHGDKIVILSQMLSLQRHWDKAVNNALIAKTIEVCASRHEEWIMYGRMGNHPTLDNFKENNGFMKFQLTRFFIPLTRKGKLAIKLGLHRELKDTVPQTIKRSLFPIYNWVSRTRMRIRLLLH